MLLVIFIAAVKPLFHWFVIWYWQLAFAFNAKSNAKQLPEIFANVAAGQILAILFARMGVLPDYF